MDEAAALADRVGILDEGRLVCLATVPVLLAAYESETLEQAFFAATGRPFEDEQGEEEADS
jgi:ABC-type Na+ transport system ATPase subunit NatA